MRRRTALACMISLVVVAAVPPTGCGTTGDISQRRQALDQDGNGRCDFAENDFPPLPPADAFSAPFHVKVKVSLAEGVDPPRRGRIALIITEFSGPNQAAIYHELFTTELPGELPAVVDFHIDALPPDILEKGKVIQTAEEREYLEAGYVLILANSDLLVDNVDAVAISARLVIYDDVDGDGRMDIGKRYPSVPGPDAGDREWQRYFREWEAWHEKYGQLDFAHFSSPSDPENEVISLTPLMATYIENVLVQRTGERPTGYIPALATEVCTRYQEGDQTCEACRTELDPLDPDVQSFTVSWAIPD